MAATEQQITESLTALAVVGGNAAHAVEAMRAAGLEPPPDRTLRRWRTEHAERYQEIAKRLAPQVEAQLVTTYREIALSAAHLTGDLIDKTRDQLAADEIKDPSAAARNIATAGAIVTDKMLVVDGRPTQIQGQLTGDELIRRLNTYRTLALALNGTAEEITDAEEAPTRPVAALTAETDRLNAPETSEDEAQQLEQQNPDDHA